MFSKFNAVALMGMGMLAGAAVGGPAPQPGPVLDQAGDALLPFYEDDFAHDLASVDSVFDLTTDTFVVNIRFHTDLSESPHYGDIPNLVAFVSFDLDHNANTGHHPEQNGYEFFELAPIGVEMEVGVVPVGRSNAGGVVDGADFLGDVVYAPEGIVLTYDLNVLRDLGVDPGEYFFTALIGTTNQPTDALSALGRSRVVVPTPGAGSLAVLAGLAAMGRRRR